MYFKTHLHSQTLTLEQFSYDLEWTLRFPTKENPNNYGEGIVQLANHVAVQCQSKVSIYF